MANNDKLGLAELARFCLYEAPQHELESASRQARPVQCAKYTVEQHQDRIDWDNVRECLLEMVQKGLEPDIPPLRRFGQAQLRAALDNGSLDDEVRRTKVLIRYLRYLDFAHRTGQNASK